jgi:stage V sporulation protein G
VLIDRCSVMKITDVRIFRKESDDRKLRAFAIMTLDDAFVVRDIKIIEGAKGLFVAMPSRRAKEPCPQCHHRVAIRSHYCNQCGANLEASSKLKPHRHDPAFLKGARQNEHRDIAHPITVAFRDAIQKAVLDAYEKCLADEVKF